MSSGFELPPVFTAVFIGLVVSTALFGLTTHQGYQYFARYPNDRKDFRWLVIILWSFDTLHTIFSIHYCYHYLIQNYMKPLALLYSTWTLPCASFVVAMTGFFSNCFYVVRLYRLGVKNIFVVTALAISLCIRFGFACASVITAIIHPIFSEYHRFSWMIVAAFAGAVATDTVLATLTTWKLRNSRTGHPRTDRVLDVMILYSINTGVLTSLFSIAGLITSIIDSPEYLYLGVHAVLGKLYVNSVLAVFNSRKTYIDRENLVFRGGAFDLDEEESFRSSGARFPSRGTIPSVPSIAVQVWKTEETRLDSAPDLGPVVKFN